MLQANMRKKEILRMLRLLEDHFVSGKVFRRLTRNPHLKNCWQLLNCGNKRCPSYGRKGSRCWHTTGTFCPAGKRCQRFSKKWMDCRKCIVFHKSTPTPELRELELLNNIIFSINHENVPMPADQPDLLRRLKLTPRELQVFELARKRHSRKEMAQILMVGEETVKMHLSHLFKKLKIRRRSELYSQNFPVETVHAPPTSNVHAKPHSSR